MGGVEPRGPPLVSRPLRGILKNPPDSRNPSCSRFPFWPLYAFVFGLVRATEILPKRSFVVLTTDCFRNGRRAATAAVTSRPTGCTISTRRCRRPRNWRRTARPGDSRGPPTPTRWRCSSTRRRTATRTCSRGPAPRARNRGRCRNWTRTAGPSRRRTAPSAGPGGRRRPRRPATTTTTTTTTQPSAPTTIT